MVKQTLHGAETLLFALSLILGELKYAQQEREVPLTSSVCFYLEIPQEFWGEGSQKVQ